MCVVEFSRRLWAEAAMRLFQGQRQPVEALAFSADSRYLAATDGRGVSIHDVAVGRTLQRIPDSKGRPHLLAFFRDGRLAVVAEADMRLYVEPLCSGVYVGFPDELQSRPSALCA